MRLEMLRTTRTFVVVISLACLALVFLTVWAQSRVDRAEVALAQEVQLAARNESRIEILSVDVEQACSLREVESRATSDLGLATPRGDQVVLLDLPHGKDGKRNHPSLVEPAYAGSRR